MTEQAGKAGVAGDFARDKLTRAPQLERSLLWESFWECHTMRPPSFSGLATIPVDRLHWYADNESFLDGDEREAFIWIMRRTDAFYVSKHNAKAAEAAKLNK